MNLRTTVEPSWNALTSPYALVTNVPAFLDRDGRLWLERLWHHDFAAHMRYIKNLTLVAPTPTFDAARDLVRVEVLDDAHLRVVPLPVAASMRGAIAALPRTLRSLWEAIGQVRLVHAGIAGWPYPLGWLAVPLARLRRKRVLVIVESAPWRLTGAGAPSVKARVRALLGDVLGRWCVNRADLALFTQPSYRRTLMTRRRGRSYVTPATWIREEHLLDPEVARRGWDQLLARRPLRVLFVGRLTQEKGVDVLLTAIDLLRERRVPLDVGILGSGERRADCAARTGDVGGVSVAVHPPLPYGPEFLEFLGRFHAVVVPSLSDEQPRIVFDAFARARPVIASDTDGLRPHVVPGRTGWVVPRGVAPALADTLQALSRDASPLRAAGLEALAYASQFTHEGMHRRRSQLLRDVLRVR